MLANQSDFMAYAGAFKSNYRKGVHRLETILSNPTHAAEFAANLGGVSVVLGVPVNLPDRNSDKLLELLLGSDVADDAVETWLHQFYEFTGWDDLLSDSARCKEMANNPLIWRAAGGSKLAVGKSIATLAGLSCSAYKDIDAVVTSQVAMTAIIGNPTALNAVVTSQVAMAAVASSQVAMTAVAASQVAMAAVIGNATALNAVVTSSVAMAAVAASQVAMTAIVKSPVAMAAMWRSDTAIKALQANATAWKTFTGASSAVMGKTVAILANLDPSGYADMTAIAASQVAMAAVAASAVALNAICKNATARSAFIGSSYRDTYYSKILSSLQNTAYFTVVINAGAMTNTTSLLYYNGTKQAVSTALSADDSFILIPTLQSYNSSSYCYVYDLQTGSTIAHYTHDRLTTANLVIPGGVRASNIYGGSGHTTYYVFKAK